MSVWPILLTDPSLDLPPVDRCPGSRPSQAAKLRPLSNVSRSDAKAATAPAVTGPIPGMVQSLRSSVSVFEAASSSSVSRSITYVSRAICSRDRAHLSQHGRQITGFVSERVLQHLEARRPFWCHETELSQMTTKRVDQLRPLPHQTLVGAEGDCKALCLGALHCHEAHRGSRPRLRNGLGTRIRAIVLLALDEELHVDGRNQPDFMAVRLRYPTPVMRRRTGLHRNHASRMFGQQRNQTRPRLRPIVENRPTRPDGADLKASLRQVDRQHAEFRH